MQAAITADIFTPRGAFCIAFFYSFAVSIVVIAAVWAFNRVRPEAVFAVLFIIFVAFLIAGVVARGMVLRTSQRFDVLDFFAVRMFVVTSTRAFDLFPDVMRTFICG